MKRFEGPLLFASNFAFKNPVMGIPQKFRKICRIKSEEREILLKEGAAVWPLQEDSYFAGKSFTTDENVDKIECITKILQDITGNVRKWIRWICEE